MLGYAGHCLLGKCEAECVNSSVPEEPFYVFWVEILGSIYPALRPGRVDSIATGYGLDGPGIESWWERDFPHLSRPALGPTQPPV